MDGRLIGLIASVVAVETRKIIHCRESNPDSLFSSQ
jgi:hypothetical protein